MLADLRQRHPHPGVQFRDQRGDVRAELRAGRAQRIGGLQRVAALHPPPTLRAAAHLDLEVPRLQRGRKFDWLFDCWVKRGLFRRVVEKIALEQLADLEDKFNRNRQHDERAALVCLLTAAGVFTGNYAAVGSEAGGYFFLPPWHNWATWAREELDRQRAREPGLDVWIGGSRFDAICATVPVVDWL